MATLREDIDSSSAWIVKAFASDGIKLDYSLKSLLEIDRFCELNMLNGQPRPGGRLAESFGSRVFAMAAYLAKTLLQNAPGASIITDDSDPEAEMNFKVRFLDQSYCMPTQRMIRRLRNGLEDGIYPYGFELTKEFQSEIFDNSFWEIWKSGGVDEKFAKF